MTANERLAKLHEHRKQIADLLQVAIGDVSIVAHDVPSALWPLPQSDNGSSRINDNTGGLSYSHKPDGETSVGDITLYSTQEGRPYAGECLECGSPVVTSPAPVDIQLYARAAGLPIVTNWNDGPSFLCPVCEWNKRGAEPDPDPMYSLPDCPYQDHEQKEVSTNDGGATCTCHNCDREFTADTPSPDRDFLAECECGKCGEIRRAVTNPDSSHEFYCTRCDESEATEVGVTESDDLCPGCGHAVTLRRIDDGNWACPKCGQSFTPGEVATGIVVLADSGGAG